MPTDRLEARWIEACEAVRPTLTTGSRVLMVSDEALATCDRRDTTGKELPVFTGGSPFSAGDHESASRRTEGHCDNPARDRTIAPDGQTVVGKGRQS